MKIALVCPASLPATQFGGIVFLAVDLAHEISKMGHDVTIYKLTRIVSVYYDPPRNRWIFC